jgi:heptaprenyl diphosphate synthase
LLLLAGRFGEAKDGKAVIQGAAAIELVHEATLYHDDIVDRSETRRGTASTVGEFGPVTAAFAGSELLYAGMSLCTEMPRQVRDEIARTTATLCQGQIREVEGTGDPERSVRERVEIMLQKTASLFRLAARMGMFLSEVPGPLCLPLERYAIRFGLCFQLADDLSDLAEAETKLGKSPRQDLHSGVYTLPVLLALQVDLKGSLELRHALRALRESGDDALAERAVEIIRRLGGLDLAQALLDSWIARARAELQRLPPTFAKAAQISLDALLALLEVSPSTRKLESQSGTASVH